MKRLHEIVTSLDSLTTSGSHRAQQKFSKQQGGQRRQNISTLKRALNLLSGGDQAAMLEELNSCFVGPELYETMTKRHEQCLANIREEFYAIPQNERVKVLCLVAKSYPAKFLKEIGFEFPLSLYQSARKFTRVPHNPMAEFKPLQLPVPGMLPNPMPFLFPEGPMGQGPLPPNYGPPSDQKVLPNQTMGVNQTGPANDNGMPRPLQTPPGMYPRPIGGGNNEMLQTPGPHQRPIPNYGMIPENEMMAHTERFMNQQRMMLNSSEYALTQGLPQGFPGSTPIPQQQLAPLSSADTDEKKKKTPKKKEGKKSKDGNSEDKSDKKTPLDAEEHKKSLKRKLGELLSTYSDMPIKHRKTSPLEEFLI